MRDGSGYLSEDTIGAIATELGGAISIIRVSGPKAFASLSRIAEFRASGQTEPRKLIRSHLLAEDGQPIDDALFVRFISPQSYTGEDLVEYHLHGGAFVAKRVLERLFQLGVRQALPGEFSFRAVRNGKMSLFQAESVADLIASSNETASTLALEKMSGSLNRQWTELSEALRKTAVLGELGIDFADQDIDEVSLPALKSQVRPLIQQLENLYRSYDRGIRFQEGIQVAFVGLPNAGKSSFFNALLGEERSIVSDIAGTTRDVVREKITIRGKTKSITLRLEDTAGLRKTSDQIEKMGIHRTLKAAQESDLILFIIDASSPQLDSVQTQWDLLTGSTSVEQVKNKTIGILTKSDLVPTEQLTSKVSELKTLGISHWVATSVFTGDGIADAIEQMIQYCEQWYHRNPGELILTRLDHLKMVESALEHLHRAIETSDIDLFAADIRQSLHSLGPLIGQTPADDILNKIFSDFCIGK